MSMMNIGAPSTTGLESAGALAGWGKVEGEGWRRVDGRDFLSGAARERSRSALHLAGPVFLLAPSAPPLPPDPRPASPPAAVVRDRHCLSVACSGEEVAFLAALAAGDGAGPETTAALRTSRAFSAPYGGSSSLGAMRALVVCRPPPVLPPLSRGAGKVEAIPLRRRAGRGWRRRDAGAARARGDKRERRAEANLLFFLPQTDGRK